MINELRIDPEELMDLHEKYVQVVNRVSHLSKKSQQIFEEIQKSYSGNSSDIFKETSEVMSKQMECFLTYCCIMKDYVKVAGEQFLEFDQNLFLE